MGLETGDHRAARPILGVIPVSTSAVGGCPITSKEKGWGWGRRAACSMGLELAVPGTCVGLFQRRSQQKNVTGRVGLVLLAAFALKSTEGAELPPSASAGLPGCGVRAKGEVCPSPWCSPTALLPHTLFPILSSGLKSCWTVI